MSHLPMHQKIIRQLPQQSIYFIPDQHLGNHLAGIIPEKNFILGEGFCCVHTSITRSNLEKMKKSIPDALVLAHPECTEDVLALADYIGSTSGILQFASESLEKKYIICSEAGVLHQLKKKNPDKHFYTVPLSNPCHDMKKITVEKVINCLESMSNQVEIEEQIRQQAMKPLARMMELSI